VTCNTPLTKPKQVFALVRTSSLTKPLLTSFTSRGATIVSTDFSSTDALVPSVTGMHVVISCLTMLQRTEEIALIEASSRVKVGRYVPSWFGPVCPPRGVMRLRDAVSIALHTTYLRSADAKPRKKTYSTQ
jgi:hypothetical protein